MDVRVGLWRKLNAEELMLLNCGVGEDSWIPWTPRRSNQLFPKKSNPEFSLEGLKLSWNSNTSATWCKELHHEKILLLGKTEGRRSRGRQRMRWLDGISKLTDISWASSRSWWWTGKPGLPQSMGSQSWTWLTVWTYWLTAPWKKSYDKARQCIKRQRHQFADKGLYTQSYDFPIVMYGCIHLTIKKAVPPRNWCFLIVGLGSLGLKGDQTSQS